MNGPNLPKRISALPALALASILAQAQTSPFDVVTEGSFTAFGAPPADVTVLIDHTTASSIPFPLVSLVATEKVIFTTSPPSVQDGAFTFRDSEGNTLSGVFSGILLPTADPAVMTVTGPFDFSGGSGPFAGATGGGTLDALITFTTPDLSAGVSTIEWKGTVQQVPEPNTTALFGLGLAALVWSRRCRG